MTVEDPIEYELAGVGQTQVNARIGMTFARALRSILRQDPDVIMIGEIRDLETAQIAVQASLTGHLVLATLHTNDAARAVTRLADMGVEPYLLASSLLGVLAQRLVRKLCPQCKEERIEVASSTGMRSAATNAGNRATRAGSACTNCCSTDDGSARRSTATPPKPRSAPPAARSGMRTMREDGERWLRDGLTSQAEMLRVTRRNKRDAGISL